MPSLSQPQPRPFSKTRKLTRLRWSKSAAPSAMAGVVRSGSDPRLILWSG
jgi:hypothetical protein